MPSPQYPKLDTQAWWTYRITWLLIGLPALAVVGSIFTLYLAIKNPDPVIDPNYYKNGLALSQDPSKTAPPPQQQTQAAAAYLPAQSGRNHATTGGDPVSK